MRTATTLVVVGPTRVPGGVRCIRRIRTGGRAQGRRAISRTWCGLLLATIFIAVLAAWLPHREHQKLMLAVEPGGWARMRPYLIPDEWRIGILEDLLAPLQTVDEVRLEGPQVDAHVLDQVLPFRGISSLAVRNTSLTDACIDKLATLPGLRMIDVTGSPVTVAGATRLQRLFPEAEVIRNYSLEEARCLRRLVGSGADITVNGGNRIVVNFDMTDWRCACCCGCLPNRRYEQMLAEAERKERISDAATTDLIALDQMTMQDIDLYISNPGITDEGLRALKGMACLRRVLIQDGSCITGECITDFRTACPYVNVLDLRIGTDDWLSLDL